MNTSTNDFVISAIKIETGIRVYLDFDSASGGYPYWSPHIKTFNSLDEVRKRASFYGILKQVKDIMVYEVDLVQLGNSDALLASAFGNIQCEKENMEKRIGELEQELKDLKFKNLAIKERHRF